MKQGAPRRKEKLSMLKRTSRREEALTFSKLNGQTNWRLEPRYLGCYDLVGFFHTRLAPWKAHLALTVINRVTSLTPCAFR